MTANETSNRKLFELYPDVERLTLFVAFEEADAEAEPNYQQIIFTAESDAAFRLDCSREECGAGGFDYAPLVDELVRSEADRVHGKISCQGTLGTGAGCALQSEYRIIVQRKV